MHHKIVVVDGEQGLVGGINISDRYNDIADEPAWLDWAAHVIGESAATLEQICIETWNLELVNKSKRLPKTPTRPDYKVNANCLVGVRRNDWVMRKNQISKTYFDMCRNANEEMIILSSYFLPGRLFRRGLKRAVRRGVKIRLILAGKSDIALAKYAERYMYTWLLRNQIRIFEYQPTVLHGKVATMDSRRTTIGSFNVNNISAYSSIELNLDVDNAEFAESVQHQFEKIMQEDCVEITVDDFNNKTGVFAKFSQYMSYWIVRFTYFVFTFYFKQKE
jgi:cardiolipin synthase